MVFFFFIVQLKFNQIIILIIIEKRCCWANALVTEVISNTLVNVYNIRHWYSQCRTIFTFIYAIAGKLPNSGGTNEICYNHFYIIYQPKLSTILCQFISISGCISAPYLLIRKERLSVGLLPFDSSRNINPTQFFFFLHITCPARCISLLFLTFPTTCGLPVGLIWFCLLRL